MLTVCTWLWGNKFGDDHVSRLFSSVDRNLREPHRNMLITERERVIVLPSNVERHAIKDVDLTQVKGCFARLRMFDSGWQKNRGIDDRLVCVDLDSVITGPLDPLFDRPEDFVIMQGGNASNPCPYNGALMMIRPGANEHLWTSFSLEAASSETFFSFPDDQGWIAARAPLAAGWRTGPEHGVYVYRKPGWPMKTMTQPAPGTGQPRFFDDMTDDLPPGARLVTFINKDPSRLGHLPWVQEHWR